MLFGDLSALVLLRAALRAIRDHAAFGAAIGGVVRALLPKGNLSGYQIGAALILGLLVTGNYRQGDARKDSGRLLLGSAFAIALPIWREFWGRQLAAATVEYLLTCGILWLALFAERRAVDAVVTRVRSGRRNAARLVLVGPAADCLRALENNGFSSGSEYKAVGILDLADPPHPDALGHIGQLRQTLHDAAVDTVVVCGYLPDLVFQQVVDSALAADCHLLSVPRSVEMAGVTPSIFWRDGLPLVQLTRPALRGQQLFLKRLLDLLGSVVGLVILSPILAAIWVLVRLDSKGPGVFAQPRLGRNGRTFKCLKFRSMHADAEERLRSDPALYAEYVANNYKLPAERDPRHTGLGRFLRRTSLDELPQLVNVLRGQMSLVGPRPIVPDEIQQYRTWGALFLSLKPGITGAWAVNGRSSVTYPDRADLELNYVRSWSLVRDIGILLRTIPVVVRRVGAH